MEPQNLVAGMLAGDEAAWRRFLADYGRLVYAVAARLGLDESEREDHFQAVSLRVHRSLSSLRSADRLSAWLYNIAYRAGIDALRRRRPAHDLSELDEARLHLEPAALSRLEQLEELALVTAAVDGLEARCRELLRALFFEDPPPSYETISRRAGLPIGSIGPTRARCLEKLKNRLGGLSEAPPPPSTDRKVGTGPTPEDDSQETRE